jgi:Ran GTPase-activating protein (RanGAP) involved in mRNA processing and transport
VKLKEVLLYNNAMTDKIICYVLQGLERVRPLPALTIGKNEMGIEALKILIRILPRLTELRLNNIKTSSNITNLLIYDILKKNHAIEKLGLSKRSFTISFRCNEF